MTEEPLNDQTLTIDTEAPAPVRKSRHAAVRSVTNFQPSAEAIRVSNSVTRKTILELREQDRH